MIPMCSGGVARVSQQQFFSTPAVFFHTKSIEENSLDVVFFLPGYSRSDERQPRRQTRAAGKGLDARKLINGRRPV